MFVSDELMGKLLKSTNIATKDVTDDEIHDRSVRFVKWLETLKNEGKMGGYGQIRSGVLFFEVFYDARTIQGFPSGD